MRELRAKLEAADGPDRELDAELDVLMFGGETIWKTTNYTMELYPASRRPSKQHVGGYANEHVPHYTASVDAAVALAERVHGWSWRVGNTPSGRGFAYLGTSLREHEAATPAIALCLAILRASQEGSEPS